MTTTQRRQPRSRPATLARKRDILDAAVEIFGSKGFAAGTLQDIADQVGMTHAGILHHFGSKDQLLLEVLRHRDETDVADLEEQHMPDGLELFRHLVQTAFVNAQRAGIVQAYVVLSAESVTDDHPGRVYFEKRYETLRREVAQAFRVVCAERGITAPDTIGLASASILAVMDGLQVQWLLDPQNVDLGQASAFAIEAILASVLSTEPLQPRLA
ncbi:MULTISPECIES: TetR/AcrR family transcriptional regulator [unclassified Microbacterium]|uniref:TetR/AcrR family transcriptional regulator n=1 Tax=unclassified Microbacterium TaxID=2609290 RepID=UPI000F5519E4|nr:MULTISPECIES: TetR/AcrR family transcriptional regulator [unclassified Microbacterium]AZC14484.1 TetR/AcrR family transcriptional regulator [Microbacterium sp. ABRD28]TQK20170.1 TetR family transcriptional regulator [Microbacterium sp. SLBN-154]